MPKKLKFRNQKAKAWAIAADTLEGFNWDHRIWGVETTKASRQHIIKSVIPSMRRRAEIIERNTKRG